MHFTSSVKTPRQAKDYGMQLKSIDKVFKLISGRDGREIIQKQTPIQQSEYQKSLDLGTTAPRLTSESVRYWSDYNRVYYHPRSIVQLNEYDLNSQTMPFEDWNVGEELFKDLDKEHDLLDRDSLPSIWKD